ncbi:HAMP domain-containing histidine kinase [Croceicoccus ponticola]|uniref:histidine kinase n=1 Tax=Croceicoccus ponticola TaxID=2217664 RepID=A0A437GZ10_9SPHN|nr:HAMP domain-containing sensor histidine kinase [Croceicoccus ponticola]RVQ67780.1 HAMP domain-containing histidine kinase [Croceicoccus ponticola]
MKRFLPRSLQGQMLLAVALALLVAQGIGAGLAMRAQAEREHNSIAHALAFRLIGSRMLRGPDGDELHPPRGRHPRIAQLATSPRSPMTAGDAERPWFEARLTEILNDQGVEVAEINVFERDFDETMMADFMQGRRGRMRDRGPPDSILFAAVRVNGAQDWLIARALHEKREPYFMRSLLLQTLLIYAVLMGTIALILRRITKPLAQLTRRVEAFSGNPTLGVDGRVEPQGPVDTRSLIAAHNAMESRIVALLDEKDVMLGAIGHDLKTPLAALRVRIESVEDDDERAKMAGTIEDITSTLDDILSLARVGRPSDPIEPTELAALTASVVEEFEDMGQPVELGDTHRVVLSVRATWLRRAIRNLTSNAIRYAGGASVTVTKEKAEAVIRVTDEGPGIPVHEIARMMEPFERGDPSRNRGTGGAGIGLALARAIAEQHGGRLVLTNRPQGGLSAEIRLPL